ncbi:hypothetical protein [Hymenobacter lucidus]|uniref:ASCH domain-containing protein n=1 Tax=Hymenobacter lucidus TaxID=2880930 RepID=A0ABS8AWB3_9BACT|nr:hypothetical protein [Hymenobacter lucidus]MCB2410001.1 hypothetical protein [Hymenobacter lucidus]
MQRLLSFSPLMLDALRAGRKTVTRRRFAPTLLLNEAPDHYQFQGMSAGSALFTNRQWPAVLVEPIASPFGQPGEVLRVQEAPSVRLEITAVWAEQVQAITEAQALAEGIVLLPAALGSGPGYSADSEAGRRCPQASAVDAFRTLIESIYPTAWSRNEWVWVVEFRVVE